MKMVECEFRLVLIGPDNVRHPVVATRILGRGGKMPIFKKFGKYLCTVAATSTRDGML